MSSRFPMIEKNATNVIEINNFVYFYYLYSVTLVVSQESFDTALTGVLYYGIGQSDNLFLPAYLIPGFH